MIRKTVGLALDVALAALVVAVLATAATGPVATLTGREALILGGGSMAPTIRLGSLVLIEPMRGQSIKVGDVATFRTAQAVVVTHRVVRVVERPDGTWYETKGDSNAQPDPALWPATAAVGRVVAAVPGLGYASWLLRQPLGWLNVLTVAGWLLLARRMVRGPGSDPGPASDHAETTAQGSTVAA